MDGYLQLITRVPLELRRRFTLGTFFFDLSSVAQREPIWTPESVGT